MINKIRLRLIIFNYKLLQARLDFYELLIDLRTLSYFAVDFLVFCL